MQSSHGPQDGISVEIRLIENAKSLKAAAKVSFDSSVGEFTASGFRVIEKEPGKPWVGFPQESYEQNGKWMNIPILEFAPRGKRLIAEAILAEYRRITGGGSSEISSRPQKV
jgi:DNA-binding cell septation regulator SpoVG